MRRLQIIIVAVIAAFCVIAANGMVACSALDTGGFAAGRAEGYKAGEAAGYLRGENDGYQKGLAAGAATDNTALITQATKDGYNDGLRIGNATGYKAGYTDGDFAGYRRGYKEGYDVGRLADVSNSIILHDPTVTEITAFLQNDNTNTRLYAAGVYDDKYFARDLCNAAVGHGLRCAYVLLYFTDTTTHALVAFKSGSSLVYYEPQTDAGISPTINGIWVDNVTGENKRIRDILVVW